MKASGGAEVKPSVVEHQTFSSDFIDNRADLDSNPSHTEQCNVYPVIGLLRNNRKSSEK